MNFQISALKRVQFEPLFQMNNEALANKNIIRSVVIESYGTPCRVSLEDAKAGETVLLLNYQHQAGATPYQAAHAIFVRQNAMDVTLGRGEIPDSIKSRLISVRAFDTHDMMHSADVTEGQDLAELITHLFTTTSAAYLHLHNARQGCYAARVDR